MKKTQTFLDLALLTAAVATVLFTLAAFTRGYTATLFADSWTVLMDYQAAGFRLSAESLLSFHAEHRPLLARIPILLDFCWVGGRGWLPLGLILATQFAHAWLLWRIAIKQCPQNGLLQVSLALFCCFYFSQMENFLWSFQTAFVLNFFFATAAVAAVAAQKESGDNTRWALAVGLCACAAPLCLASGVFVWFLVAAMAVAVRLPWRWAAGYATMGAATLALYLIGYQRPRLHNDPLDALSKPRDVAAYVLHFLGSSWRWWPLPVGKLLAAGAIVLLVIRTAAFLRGERRNPWEAAPLAVMIFSLGTALLMALGRLNFGIGQAGASRYQTPALLFWFMAALLALPFFNGRVLRVCVLVSMVWSFAGTSVWFEGVERERRHMDIAGAAFLSGVADLDMMAPMTAGNQLPLYWPLRERRLGPFGVNPAAELGTTLEPTRIRLAPCEGGFSRERSFFEGPWPGVRLTGFVRGPVHRLVAVHEGRIVGLGVDGVVFAAARSSDEKIEVYGVLAGGQLCPVAVN